MMISGYTLVIWGIWGELLGMEGRCQLTRTEILLEAMEEIEN